MYYKIGMLVVLLGTILLVATSIMDMKLSIFYTNIFKKVGTEVGVLLTDVKNCMAKAEINNRKIYVFCNEMLKAGEKVLIIKVEPKKHRVWVKSLSHKIEGE